MNDPYERIRNPSRPWRVAIVACVLAVPGLLGGAMFTLVCGQLGINVALGILAGATAGAVTELWPDVRQ